MFIFPTYALRFYISIKNRNLFKKHYKNSFLIKSKLLQKKSQRVLRFINEREKGEYYNRLSAMEKGSVLFSNIAMFICFLLFIFFMYSNFYFLYHPYNMGDYVNKYEGTLKFICKNCNVEELYKNRVSRFNYYAIGALIIWAITFQIVRRGGISFINSAKKSKKLLDLISIKVMYFLLLFILVGLFFSGSYLFIYSFDSSVIKIPEKSEFDILTAIYFSFVTLTTLGYGEITPISDAAKIFTMLESTIGVLYLSVVIGTSVGYGISSFTRESERQEALDKQ
jgi:hypothetical protein